MKIENVADLQVLVHTARGGTLTAAARALGMTPAAASAALKRLETQLGSRLFERSTRAMRLTTQGQILLDYANRAFELLAEGESMVAADSGALIGTLRVAAPSDLARNTLLPWFSEFLAAHPGLQLALSVGDRPLDVTRDEVDVALRYGTLADSRLIARPLAQTRPVLCAAPAYLARCGTPATPQDLLQHNCITFDRAGRQHRLWRFAQHGQWTEVRVQGDRGVDDASLAREWAVAGVGIVLKSELDVRQELANGSLLRLLPGWDTEPYPLHALLPSGRFVPQRVRALVDFLALKFAQLLAPA
ncbi:DNA-binding transcriptional LysR family regulator [Rhodoferax ferrireducens]|uniref:DNA-binding transcriptional LysR family regulator n=1 Tax=Rhodoferax ferrireducens TaxID=192843 RepID=A0ABU2C3V7_9BURK|nr:LysR family transcriptional regulator [Rhodoferax ferrireducens]MDR7376005.1 DNA-binding transcriptional LysR family regulator [Rhodoferax ferrireducens]